jgi:hypothetical protein
MKNPPYSPITTTPIPYSVPSSCYVSLVLHICSPPSVSDELKEKETTIEIGQFSTKA